MNRIVFFGTPALAVPFLQALVADADTQIVGVVTQPDRPAGRGRHMTPCPVKEAAVKAGLKILTEKELSEVTADFFVVVAYGKIIKKQVLALPDRGCINVHPSLLPRWRGPSPLVWALREGDRETGITIMLMDEGMDTGPILLQEKISLSPEETQETLTQKVMAVGPALLIDAIKKYMQGTILPQPQDHAQATYSKLLERQDGELDLSRPCEVIERLVRAYHPWPGTWVNVVHHGKPLRLKILEVRCAHGSLDVLRVQPEGKQSMAWEDFRRGYPDVMLEEGQQK